MEEIGSHTRFGCGSFNPGCRGLRTRIDCQVPPEIFEKYFRQRYAPEESKDAPGVVSWEQDIIDVPFLEYVPFEWLNISLWQDRPVSALPQFGFSELQLMARNLPLGLDGILNKVLSPVVAHNSAPYLSAFNTCLEARAFLR